ncbi:MAG TPA: branched-chain amino acid ABC transporter permease [Verrucomicrobiae bacterium]|nr:branched-chain amino acid ABC transporter permease [Verrucomicrobiae bacterium]
MVSGAGRHLAFAVAIAFYVFIPSAAQAAATGSEEAVRRCQELMPAFVKAPLGVTIGLQDEGPAQPFGVRLDWRAPAATGSTGTPEIKEGWMICWFLPRKSAEDAWQMTQLNSSEFGMMRRYDIQQLYKMLRLMQYQPQTFDPEADTLKGRALYVLQQTINAISLGCVYALIAIGFTLVYGITRVINFAFGDLYMFGAFTAYVASIVFAYYFGSVGIAAVLLVGAGACVIMGAGGWAMDKLIFQPMRGMPTTAALIAAIGLSIAMKDSVRLLQGPKTRYLLTKDLTTWPIVTGHGFDVYLSKGHLVVGFGTMIIAGLLWRLSQRSDFGRSQRACAQDPRMAALLGVNVNRIIGLTFVMGGTLAGAGGVFAGLQYGVINFHMGTLMGFKALTAALVGGIGSLPGAFLGALIIAAVECFTAAFLGSQWKDIAVFALLVLILLLRPAGLLGTLRTQTADERP